MPGEFMELDSFPVNQNLRLKSSLTGCFMIWLNYNAYDRDVTLQKVNEFEQDNPHPDAKDVPRKSES